MTTTIIDCINCEQKLRIPTDNGTPILTCSSCSKGDSGDIGNELVITDENGIVAVASNEIPAIPLDSDRLDTSDHTVQSMIFLATELLKEGEVSIQNKTIKLVFKKEIQEGIKDGSYTLMKTKQGEVLADAVNSKGTVVGKGRIIESGKVRQLATSIFQITSIAVAQSHLADINRSLDSINSLLAAVLSKLENEDKSKITGAIAYLKEIADYISRSELSQELSQSKSTAIEIIIMESYTWRNKLHEDFRTLVDNISNQRDIDPLGGTKDTFKKLIKLVGKSEALIERHKLLMELSNLISLITMFLDPTQHTFTRVQPSNEAWTELVNNFRAAAIKSSKERISNAVFNSKKTLRRRRKKIEDMANKHSELAFNQQKVYEEIMHKIRQRLDVLARNDGNIHIAISYDQNSEIKEAAII